MNNPVQPHWLNRLLEDDRGALAVDVILYTSIITLGAIVGLSTFRDQVVQYFGDTAVAIDNLDQSFSVTVNGVTITFVDTPTLTDPVDAPPACMSLVVPADPE